MKILRDNTVRYVSGVLVGVSVLCGSPVAYAMGDSEGEGAATFVTAQPVLESFMLEELGQDPDLDGMLTMAAIMERVTSFDQIAVFKESYAQMLEDGMGPDHKLAIWHGLASAVSDMASFVTFYESVVLDAHTLDQKTAWVANLCSLQPQDQERFVLVLKALKYCDLAPDKSALLMKFLAGVGPNNFELSLFIRLFTSQEAFWNTVVCFCDDVIYNTAGRNQGTGRSMVEALEAPLKYDVFDPTYSGADKFRAKLLLARSGLGAQALPASEVTPFPIKGFAEVVTNVPFGQEAFETFHEAYSGDGNTAGVLKAVGDDPAEEFDTLQGQLIIESPETKTAMELFEALRTHIHTHVRVFEPHKEPLPKNVDSPEARAMATMRASIKATMAEDLTLGDISHMDGAFLAGLVYQTRSLPLSEVEAAVEGLVGRFVRIIGPMFKGAPVVKGEFLAAITYHSSNIPLGRLGEFMTALKLLIRDEVNPQDAWVLFQYFHGAAAQHHTVQYVEECRSFFQSWMVIEDKHRLVEILSQSGDYKAGAELLRFLLAAPLFEQGPGVTKAMVWRDTLSMFLYYGLKGEAASMKKWMKKYVETTDPECKRQIFEKYIKLARERMANINDGLRVFGM